MTNYFPAEHAYIHLKNAAEDALKADVSVFEHFKEIYPACVSLFGAEATDTAMTDVKEVLRSQGRMT